MQHVILTMALLFSTIILGQNSTNLNIEKTNSITVSIVNALNDDGTANFALFDKENFRKQPLQAKTSKIENGKSTVIFENVPNGQYAIICFHDENENKKMDFELNGMPKENYGTSNNSLSFGPPQFENSKFELLNEDVVLEIKF